MLLLGPLIRDNGKFLLLDVKLKSSSVLTWEKTEGLLKCQESGKTSVGDSPEATLKTKLLLSKVTLNHSTGLRMQLE